MANKPLSLNELLTNIKQAITQSTPKGQWIIAEISEININYSGHCYMELIEKEEEGDKIIAKSRATIWASNYNIISSYFETATRETLKVGLKILVKGNVEFHHIYGFSINITDIDPSYTVGELAMKRALIIEKLTTDGVIDMNKMLELPLVPQRIAIITSDTAAGYDDFKEHLQKNKNNLVFHTKLFSAVMQGEHAPTSIIEAFNKVYDELDNFDAVVLIRGGGSKIDLSCFDDYDLAYFITQFPLPVITGIGHNRDESIADLVANTSEKTPTAVADFLISQLNDFYIRTEENYEYLIDLSKNILSSYEEHQNDLFKELTYIIRHKFDSQLIKIENLQHNIEQQTKLTLKQKSQHIDNLQSQITHSAQQQTYHQVELCNKLKSAIKKLSNKQIEENLSKIEYMQLALKLSDPKNVLDKGFAIIKSGNKLITKANQVKPNDKLNIQVSEGKIISKVLSV